MRCYFVRHAESEANVLGVFANEGESYALTGKGKGQARDLGHALLDQRISVAYSSPLLRAKQTSEIVCAILGIDYSIRPGLKEFSVGDLEGCVHPNVATEFSEIESKWLEKGDVRARLGGGECLDEVRSRFLAVTNELVDQFGQMDTSLLVVGHGGTLACSLPAVLENITDDFALHHRIPHTGVIEAAYESGCFICVSWAGIACENLALK